MVDIVKLEFDCHWIHVFSITITFHVESLSPVKPNSYLISEIRHNIKLSDINV